MQIDRPDVPMHHPSFILRCEEAMDRALAAGMSRSDVERSAIEAGWPRFAVDVALISAEARLALVNQAIVEDELRCRDALAERDKETDRTLIALRRILAQIPLLPNALAVEQLNAVKLSAQMELSGASPAKKPKIEALLRRIEQDLDRRA